MEFRKLTGIALLAAALALPASAAAQTDPYPEGPFAPWDGANPFNCELQDVGTGVDFPDPAADPFCVEFDKTQQNLTDLGLLAFLANEPARVGQALGKCFYYQHDHWTGSIVQGEAPELWHWDGSYVIDRGRGVFGANLQNFRILGQPASPSHYFPIPPEYAGFFDQDGIGGVLVLDLPIDPTCADKVDTPEERGAIYAGADPGPGPGPGGGQGGGSTVTPTAATAGGVLGGAGVASSGAKGTKGGKSKRKCRRKARCKKRKRR